MVSFEYRKVGITAQNNSFTLILPRKMCEDLCIGKGDYVKVALQGKTIMVTKQKDG